METWFRADHWSRGNITPVQVEKETKGVVVIAGRRVRKIDYDNYAERYFHTWKEAKDWLLARCKKRIEDHEFSLTDWRETLAHIQALREKPEEL